MEDQSNAVQGDGAASILNSSSMPHLLKQLREWFELEWGNVDPFEGNHAEIVVPSPLVAVVDQSSLVGGLSFSSFPKPEHSEIGVWINALLVAPTHRKRGIASQLIQSAELEARRVGVPELLVLTNVPNLYQNLGWKILGVERDDTILTKDLVGESGVMTKKELKNR